MDKVKNFFKKHKKKCIILGIVLVILIALIIFSYRIITYLIPNTKESVYGDRCETTVNHPIAEDRKDTIKEVVKKYDGYKFKTFEVKCNLVDIIVEVADTTNFSDVKKMGKEILAVFTDEEKKYYDLQLMVKSDKKESESYPQIGTHHKEIDGKTNEDFVW